MRQTIVQLLLFVAFFHVVSVPGSLVQADTLSGHHYSWLEGAAIGHDFGRNPWSRGGTEGFAGSKGRANLREALARAVAAGETAMSFDFGFDLRSIVEFEGTVGLDDYALPAVEAFLFEVERADAVARQQGRFFRADVVLFDYRVADGEVVDERVRGEYPALFTNEIERRAIFSALKPTLALFGKHPLITLNMMNEPEYLALPVAKAIARIKSGQWADISFVAVGKVVARGAGVVPMLAALGDDAHVRVVGRNRSQKLALSPLSVGQVDAFLLDLRAAIAEVAPQAQVTVGWADDHSALENTLRLEERTGVAVTEVISFHVYEVPINPWHPLRLARGDFAAAGLGGREIRITEWGLGRLENKAVIEAAMREAFTRSTAAGLDGVLFWWDADHVFDHGAYRRAAPKDPDHLETLVEGASQTGEFEPTESFPNPFNGRVVIPYNVETGGRVTLSVYNVAGQKVSELYRGYREPGRYRATWDGRDEEGDELASGVYFWELRGNGEVMRRMVTRIR
jgi:hypothetical protein